MVSVRRVAGVGVYLFFSEECLQFFLYGIWGALKCQKMTLGGLQVSFK